MDQGLPRRKRLPRDKREQLILEEAMKFFAEVGFDGQTRALADRLGVTQPLLYRYFPDKETLIERVLEAIFAKLWHPEWDDILRDRNVPLIDRITRFYMLYWKHAMTGEGIRIVTFAGLKGEGLYQHYFKMVRKKVLEPLCEELRHELGLPDIETLPLDELEVNLAWGPQAALSHLAGRIFIYFLPVPDDLETLVELTLRGCWKGCSEAMKEVVTARLHQAKPNLLDQRS